jgi:hypothetical protein
MKTQSPEQIKKRLMQYLQWDRDNSNSDDDYDPHFPTVNHFIRWCEENQFSGDDARAAWDCFHEGKN